MIRKLMKIAAKAVVENFSVEAAKQVGEAVGKRIASRIWTEPETDDAEDEEAVDK